MSAPLPESELPAEDWARMFQVPMIAAAVRPVVRPLTGGLTNRNYRVTIGDRSYVARLFGSSSALLEIDRDAEHANSLVAADTGVAPQVADYAPAAGVLVIDWVQARTLAPTDLRDFGTLTRVVAACRRLHAGPPFVNRFDMFTLQRRYLQIVQSHGFRLPPRYLDFMPQVERMEVALGRPAQLVPCNNDLLAANLLDDGVRTWLIDYEYSGNNDPCFELANLWSEAALEPPLLDEVIRLYYGTVLRHKVARARLLAALSQYGWTLWATIHEAVSPLDFDFWSWGMAKYDRATADFDGPLFDRWLDDALRDD